MADKNYTHEVIMFDVSGNIRMALFTSEQQGNELFRQILGGSPDGFTDARGIYFNLKQIVQINPVKLINKGEKNDEKI